jgi:hypothetical protein
MLKRRSLCFVLQHVHTLEDALSAMDSLLQNFQLHRK